MDRLRVVGGARLAGTVTVAGAKNSALKLMAAALLAPGKTTITNLPIIADVNYMAELLTRLGCTVEISANKSQVSIDVPEKLGHRADYDLVRKMRASINVLGPLIVRAKEAEVALPGGDAIGSRGLDFHINGLTDMGADISIEHGFVIAKAPNGLIGAAITLEFPSVGATENIMTAATLTKEDIDQNLEFMINYIIADTNPLKHHYDIKPSRVDINEKPKFQTDMHNKQRNKFKGKNPHNYALSLQTKQINNSIVYNEEKLNSHFRKSFQKIYSNNKKNHINKENYTDFLFNNKILSYDKI